MFRLEVGDAEQAGVLVDAPHRHVARRRHPRPVAVPLDLGAGDGLVASEDGDQQAEINLSDPLSKNEMITDDQICNF